MPNGKEMLDDLEFEKLIEGKDDRKLLEFTAWESYKTRKVMSKHGTRILRLEAALVILVLILAGTGILDYADVIHVFGLGG